MKGGRKEEWKEGKVREGCEGRKEGRDLKKGRKVGRDMT